MSNNYPIQNHSSEEKYFGDDEYFSEEESSSSLLDEDEESEKENGKTVLKTIPRDQVIKEMKKETSEEEREIREKEFRMINEDIQEEADSSSNAYISEELFDPKQIKTYENHHIENDSKNPRSISSMREHLAKRNEEIEERIRERKKREHKKLAHNHDQEDSLLLGRRKMECTREEGSLSSSGGQDDSRNNEYIDKRKIRLEHREARRIAKEKRRQARLERREERLQQKLEKKNEKLENESHKHSRHLE